MSEYVIFSAYYPPHVGGVERYTEAIARELAERGNRVTVIASAEDGKAAEERADDRTDVIRLPSKLLMNGRMPVLLPGKAWRQARKRLAEIRDPRIIIQTFLYPISLAGARLARRTRAPFILINHGSNYVCTGNGPADRAEHLYERVMARRVAKGCRGAYAVSGNALKWLDHFRIPPAGVLYNGIDTAATKKKAEELPYGIREAMKTDKDTFVIAYIGRMIREKGIVQLAEAVSRLIREGEDIALYAAGDGELMESLKPYASDRIRFTGQLGHDEVIRVLRESDCCCLPSDSEGLPTVLLEAAVCGCFLITSPYGGSPEAVGENGTVMNGNSEEDIYTAIRDAIRRTDRREAAKETGYIGKFDWSKTCDLIEALDWERAE